MRLKRFCVEFLTIAMGKVLTEKAANCGWKKIKAAKCGWVNRTGGECKRLRPCPIHASRKNKQLTFEVKALKFLAMVKIKDTKAERALMLEEDTRHHF